MNIIICKNPPRFEKYKTLCRKLNVHFFGLNDFLGFMNIGKLYSILLNDKTFLEKLAFSSANFKELKNKLILNKHVFELSQKAIFKRVSFWYSPQVSNIPFNHFFPDALEWFQTCGNIDYFGTNFYFFDYEVNELLTDEYNLFKEKVSSSFLKILILTEDGEKSLVLNNTDSLKVFVNNDETEIEKIWNRVLKIDHQKQEDIEEKIEEVQSEEERQERERQNLIDLLDLYKKEQIELETKTIKVQQDREQIRKESNQERFIKKPQFFDQRKYINDALDLNREQKRIEHRKKFIEKENVRIKKEIEKIEKQISEIDKIKKSLITTPREIWIPKKDNLYNKDCIPIIIFGNDWTFGEFDFDVFSKAFKNKVITAGINRTWKRYNCDYLCFVDPEIPKEIINQNIDLGKTKCLTFDYIYEIAKKQHGLDSLPEFEELKKRNKVFTFSNFKRPTMTLTWLIQALEQHVFPNKKLIFFLYGVSFKWRSDNEHHFWVGDNLVDNKKDHKYHEHHFGVYINGTKDFYNSDRRKNEIVSITKDSALNDFLHYDDYDNIMKTFGDFTVYHIKETPIALAPDELAFAIQKHLPFNSKVIMPSEIYSLGLPNKKDDCLLHFHNKWRSSFNDFKSCIQYHSEPFRVKFGIPKRKSLVINQYHATLPEYQGMNIVRNVINFDCDPTYLRVPIYSDKIKVAFAPSTRVKGEYCDKGVEETLPILEKLKRKYKSDFDFILIEGQTLETCLKIKRECNIIIDECMTISYHRSGLEGLAMSKMTICSMSKEVENIFLSVAGAKENPFENVWINDLEKFLLKTIDLGSAYVIEKGLSNRRWMEQYWHPKTIVNEYMKIYREILLNG